MQDVEELVLVSIPDGGMEAVSSVKEEEEEEEDGKSVLATTEFSHHLGGEVVTMAPLDLDMESSSSGADVLLKKEAVFVKLTEEVDVESDIFYPITCGDTEAVLVWKRFVCPGINNKCIQMQANQELVSPKEFVCLAGKSTLKDWKRAIRLNGAMLRKIMDSGELEFYQHAKVCSNTCRSTKIDPAASKGSAGSQQSAEDIALTPSAAISNGQSVSSDAEDCSEWVTAIGEDSVVFWCGVKQAGLLDEVLDDFREKLEDMLKSMQERVSQPLLLLNDVILLNDIVQNFGMLDLMKKVLAGHNGQMEQCRDQYNQSLAALEQQRDEHRRRAKKMKSRAQHLDHVLMTLSPAPAPPAPKHPRISPRVSVPAPLVPATGIPSPAQITLSLNPLAGVPLGNMLTFPPHGAGAQLSSGYTMLTSSSVGGQPGADGFPAHLTMLSAAAPGFQEASGAVTFLKVLGPQYQLVSLPPTTQGLNGMPQNAAVSLVVANGNNNNNSNNNNQVVHVLLQPQVVAAQADSEEDQEC